MPNATQVRNGYAVESIEVDRIHPNPWNPNRMDQQEFAEYAEEVRRLGRLPKPIVVRPRADDFEIIDGEHGWRAAQEVGLPVVICEVVDVNDFEAMRQTYKRNQSGTHNPVLQGRMFRRMMSERKVSGRELAMEIGVSEGTVRNSLQYAETADRFGGDVAKLKVRDLRILRQLPDTIGGWWFTVCDCDRDCLRKAFGFKRDRFASEHAINRAKRLEQTGILVFFESPTSPRQFESVIDDADSKTCWEERVLKLYHALDLDVFRRYAKHYYRGCWLFKDQYWAGGGMDEVLGMIYDLDSSEFWLTEEEFDECVSVGENMAHTGDFHEHLRRTLRKKHGQLPASKQHDLYEVEEQALADAPEYIRKAPMGMDSAIAAVHGR